MRVLLVEDSAAYRRYFTAIMDEVVALVPELSYECVGTLAECREMLATESYELIFLDLNLPDSKGGETIDAVSEIAACATVVILTGENESDTEAACLARGADNYLVKDQMTPLILVQITRHVALSKRKSRRRKDAVIEEIKRIREAC